jgi:hypothetical protein
LNKIIHPSKKVCKCRQENIYGKLFLCFFSKKSVADK